MSEYTRYFVVKSSSEEEVQSALNAARINSVVDADKNDYWFSPEYKRSGSHDWVVVAAPADSGFQDNRYVHEDQFNRMAAVFQTLILFFQEEDMTNWSLKLKAAGTVVEKQFHSNKTVEFSEAEKSLFAGCFGRSFDEMRPLLKAGKASDFLNSVGIPYMEMSDQDKIPASLFKNKHSLLAAEIKN